MNFSDKTRREVVSRSNIKMITGSKPLPKDFVPGVNEVLIGRGKRCYAHIGNKNFLIMVTSKLNEYSATTSKTEKSRILSSIVSEIQKKSSYGGFIRRDHKSGLWVQVGDFIAREKTSQAFRDALHGIYRSSNFSRKKARKTIKMTVTSTLTSQLVQPISSFKKKINKLSKNNSNSSKTVLDFESSSIISELSHQHYDNIEAFDNALLDQLWPSNNTDLDLHEFDMESSDTVSIIQMENEDNADDLMSTCDSLVFDIDGENDEFDTYSCDWNNNKLFQGKLFEDEISEFCDIDLSHLYMNRTKPSIGNVNISKCTSDTQDRNTNSNSGFGSIPHRNTSAAMTA